MVAREEVEFEVGRRPGGFIDGLDLMVARKGIIRLEALIVDANVAVVPGSGFGAPGHMRISFACSMETLTEALKRIGRVLGA